MYIQSCYLCDIRKGFVRREFLNFTPKSCKGLNPMVYVYITSSIMVKDNKTPDDVGLSGNSGAVCL